MKKISSILIIFLFFLSGCTLGVPAQPKEHTTQKLEPRQYQYAGPWDKDLFEYFYLQKYPLPDNLGNIKGAIVPHHLLAGAIDATLFSHLEKQQPSVLVLIGPNHFSRGQGEVITTSRNWQTPFGEVNTNMQILDALKKQNLVSINEMVVKEEHSIYTLLSFVKKSLPQTSIVPLIVQPYASTSTLDHIKQILVTTLPADAVIVGSVDFSHYKTLKVANTNDKITKKAIFEFNYPVLGSLDIDSPKSIYLILKLMEHFGSTDIVHEIHSNSAILTKDINAKETTSYYSPYFAVQK